MKGSAFLYAIMLLVGTGVGYCLGFSGSGGDGESKPAEKQKAARRSPTDVGEAASVKALRARIAQLEQDLAAAAAKAARQDAPQTNAVAVVPQQGGPGPMRFNPREWMENMKKNDPERFVQMTNRFAQFRKRRLERQQRNLDFLASVDTSSMSAAAKKTHVALQTAIAKRAELEDKIHQEGITDEERQSIMEQIGNSERALRRLRNEERRNLFRATATTLGFEGEDANEIVSTLEEVVDATDGGHRHMGPPPGAPPRRP